VSGPGREWLRALVERISGARRGKRARERTRRRRRLILQRVVTWVATHDLDAKPPTPMHANILDARRPDERFFMEEFVPQLLGWRPVTDAALQRVHEWAWGRSAP